MWLALTSHRAAVSFRWKPHLLKASSRRATRSQPLSWRRWCRPEPCECESRWKLLSLRRDFLVVGDDHSNVGEQARLDRVVEHECHSHEDVIGGALVGAEVDEFGTVHGRSATVRLPQRRWRMTGSHCHLAVGFGARSKQSGAGSDCRSRPSAPAVFVSRCDRCVPFAGSGSPGGRP